MPKTNCNLEAVRRGVRNVKRLLKAVDQILEHSNDPLGMAGETVVKEALEALRGIRKALKK